MSFAKRKGPPPPPAFDLMWQFPYRGQGRRGQSTGYTRPMGHGSNPGQTYCFKFNLTNCPDQIYPSRINTW